MDNNGTPSAEELAAMHPELVTPWHVRAGAALEKVVTVAIGVVMIAAMIAALACIAMLCVWGVVEVARGIAR